MNTFQHLSRVLPTNGLKVLAEMRQVTDENDNPVFKSDGSPSLTTWHKTFSTIEALANAVKLRSQNGHPIYMAMGGFDKEKSFIPKKRKKDGAEYKGFSRSADFTCAFKAFWLDLDIGEDKAKTNRGYIDQATALDVVNKFVADLGLPEPMLVDSGRGLHVYWPLVEEVDQASWWKLARVLDAIAKHYGLFADPSCTQDRARILRPIGTINHKNGRVVSLISDAPDTPFSTFAKSLLPYYKEHKDEVEEIKAKTKKNAYVDRSDQNFPDKPRFAKYFLSRCQVGQAMLVGKEPLPEPVWRGVISVLRHTKNGYKHIETARAKCKSRFPDTTRFDEDRTLEKLEWLEQRDMGPFTCDTFRRECPGLCAGCPFADDVKTPLTLSEHYEEIEIPQYNITPLDEVDTSEPSEPTSNEEALASIELNNAPKLAPQPSFPYKRSAQGLVHINNETETVFFRGDCFPVMTRFEEVIDGELNILLKFMIKVGLSGTFQEVAFPMKEWYSLDKLKQRLGAVGVSINDKAMQHLIGYMRKYVEDNLDKMDVVRQLQHFGWIEDNQFLLGDKLYRPNGVVTVQPHLNIKNYVRYFKKAGSLTEWKALMHRLQQLNAVEQQICMLSSFGSSLMRFTNYNGIWLHLMTQPGFGKTTTQEMMNGIWGHPQDLLLNAKDTINAIEERFGRWSNIGVTIDEVSNLDPRIASELLLGVTQGRTKQRLDTNMRERVNELSWQMMVLSSGNFSLVDKINTTKEDVAAEISRTLEFKLPKPTLSVHEGEVLIKRPIHDNYGVAGEEWLRHLVNIPSGTLKAMIERTTKAFSDKLNSGSDERFWVTGCAVMYVAGELTNKMGLTDWDMEAIFAKLCEIVESNRVNRETFEFSATDVVASFLADNNRNTVVTDVGIADDVMVKLMPIGSLNVRYEQDKDLIFIRTQALKDYCSRRGIGINSVKEALRLRGLLEDDKARKVLSKGLPTSTGRAYCLVVRVDEITRSTLDTLVEVRREQMG